MLAGWPAGLQPVSRTPVSCTHLGGRLQELPLPTSPPHPQHPLPAFSAVTHRGRVGSGGETLTRDYVRGWRVRAALRPPLSRHRRVHLAAGARDVPSGCSPARELAGSCRQGWSRLAAGVRVAQFCPDSGQEWPKPDGFGGTENLAQAGSGAFPSGNHKPPEPRGSRSSARTWLRQVRGSAAPRERQRSRGPAAAQPRGTACPRRGLSIKRSVRKGLSRAERVSPVPPVPGHGHHSACWGEGRR